MSAARDILRQLSALGARVECREDRVVLRTGRQPVPANLIEAARQVKAELSKLLNPAQDAQTAGSEHLRRLAGQKVRGSAVSVEDAHLSTLDEHLGVHRSKALTEDAHLSTFDKPEDSCGPPIRKGSKVLNSPDALVVAGLERLPWGLREMSISSEADEERAVSVSRYGEIPPEWAEGIARLHRDRPPACVPLGRWQAVVDAARVFLELWAAKAAAAGWEAADIFGADADRPEVTWLNSGPLWLANGARVVEVHADKMVLETKGGAWQSAHKRPHLRPRVLPWDLVP